MLRLRCENRVETRRAAHTLGCVVTPGTIIGLEGELGAGKTFFVGGLARGLHVPRGVAVTSPTFTLVHVLAGGRLPLTHVDLYRLENARDIDELGLQDVLYGEGVAAVEWWSRLGDRDLDALIVRLEVAGPRERTLVVEPRGAHAAEVCERWRAALAGPKPC